ncbi:MAG: carboxypeptidase-like regulatory domain-containing protein [Thermoguttaceae bacterium]|nr:carboxypeptidase-like regulatory domain-containing protein [Thermoguttaceae bacterium]
MYAKNLLRGGILCALAVMLGLCIGCGSEAPELAPVTGKVTLDGQPLPRVIVTFVPVAGGVSSSGVTNEEGVYELACQLGKGALVGQHRVYVRSQPPGATGTADVPSEDDPSYKPDPYASVRAQGFVEKIPARYNTKSELVFEVKKGKNVIDLTLSSKP